MKQLLGSALLLSCAAIAQASPGSLDKDNCHTDSKNVYHCHTEGMQTSFIGLGVNLAGEGWMYDDGPMNRLLGFGVEGMYARKSLAVVGNFNRLSNTGTDELVLTGYDIGFRYGRSLALPGRHPYLEVGYFSQTAKVKYDAEFELSGFQGGVGMMWNGRKITSDVRVLVKDSSAVKDFISDVTPDPALLPDSVFVIAPQISFMYRF